MVQKAMKIGQSAAKPPWKQEEGPTIRAWSLNQYGMAVKPHERLSRKARYDLDLCESIRSRVIKKPAITKRPYTGKLDALSEHPVTQIINKVLKNDAKKAFDIASHAQFNTTVLRCYPSGGTSTTAITLATTGTVGGTSTAALQKGHVKAIVDAMKERNIDPYERDDYYAISWPSTLRTFKNDLEDIHKYTPEGFGMIANGEIGRYENCRFVEQTHIDKAGTTYTDWCFFFGADTVAEAIAIPEEMRGRIPTDYGRSKGVAWYYLGGFGLVHTAQAQTRIIKWESLA